MLFSIIRAIFALLFCSFFLYLPEMYRQRAIPFRLSKIDVNYENPPLDSLLPLEKKEEIGSVLKQPFSFLGKGIQAYAFVSQDHKFVLKVFLFNSCKIRIGQKIWRGLREFVGRKNRKAASPDKIFNACKVALDLLREETGIFWAHLHPQPHWQKIKLIDHRGMIHWLDPARHRFILQRKAKKLLPTLSYDQKYDVAAYYKKLDSFSDLLTKLEQKGIAIMDEKIPSNFGFLDDRVIQIDFADNLLDATLAPQRIAALRHNLQQRLEKKMEKQ